MDSPCKKRRVHPFWISGTLAICFAATTRPSGAQTVPDATVPVNSTVTPNNSTFTITGGSRAGGNLFHSFNQFSVPTGTTAHFNNAPDIQNIITRVTGSSITNIDGTLKANGTANLFLINPSGIIFGPNASLNIGGSFLASTASRVKFADGREFSTTAPNTAPLLTVSVPVGLQFGASPGSIRNQSTATNSSGEVVGLAVRPEKTLALVGGDVLLEGGYLTAPGGRIELGSVAGNAAVSLTSADKGYALGYSGVGNFQDIQLSPKAVVNADGEGGGDIQIQARRVTLRDGSLIQAQTLGSKPGGTVAVSASESLEMSGANADGSILAETKGTGAAGNVRVGTRRLRLQDGATITTNSFRDGQGGNLTVQASESVELVGTSADGQSVSGLSFQAQGTGAAGNLTIVTGRLLVRDGAQVSTASFRDGQGGKGGDLTVQASESVELVGTTADARFPSGLLSLTLGAGNGGNLTLSTGRLTVRNGAQVTASTRGAGRGGTLRVSACDSIELIGKAATGELVSGLFARSRDAGDAGNLTEHRHCLCSRWGGAHCGRFVPRQCGQPASASQLYPSR